MLLTEMLKDYFFPSNVRERSVEVHANDSSEKQEKF